MSDLLDFAVHSNMDRDVSVFLGGVGDARHFYAQLAILGSTERMAAGVTSRPIVKRKYHFTMNDLKAGTLARDIILFVLLDQLAVSKDLAQTERTELYTVVYYVFLGIIIPRYVLDRLNQVIDLVIERLEKKETILPWLQVPDSDGGEIIRALRSWRDGLLVALYSTSRVIESAVTGLQQAERQIRLMFGFNPSQAPPGCKKEFDTYSEAPFLQVPRSVLNEREPDLLKLMDSDASPKRLKSYLSKNWCTNPTFLDVDWHVDAMGDLDVAFDPFQLYRRLHDILSLQEKGGPRKTKLFDYVSSFFQAVVLALRKTRGRLTAELILDDLAAAIDGVRYGLIEGRDATAPRTFDLVHLSNVPDYIGGSFFTFIYGGKILNDPKTAKLTSTCLRNTGLWKSHEEFHSEYMAVADLNALFKFTQMQMTGREEGDNFIGSMSGYIDWRRARMGAFAYEMLVSRAELFRFVVLHFLKIALPCGRSMSDTEFTHFIFPTLNLTNIFRLTIHLHEIGYPSHWLADILTRILDDQLTTSARPPRTHPVQSSEISKQNSLAKLSSAPWRAEMSTLTVLFQRLLPFSPMTTTTALPSPHAIFSYCVRIADIIPHGEGRSAMVLVFYKMALWVKTPGNFRDMGRYLDSSPEKDPHCEASGCKKLRENGCVVVTAFTWSGVPDRTVEFWMREDVMDPMRNTEHVWGCALWRVDDWKVLSSEPVDAAGVVKGECWTSSSSAEAMEM